jgi:hypothetical protein
MQLHTTTSYPLDCPDPLWSGFREVQGTDRNLNDELVLAVAAHVDRADEDLDAEAREAVDAILAAYRPDDHAGDEGNDDEDEDKGDDDDRTDRRVDRER